MTALKNNLRTIDEIESLPEGERAELIDGVIYNMSTPSATHQSIIFHISGMIWDYIKRNNGTCRAFSAPFSVYLFQDDQNYFEPDISVICDTDKIDSKGCHGAPDWVIEVVSSSTKGRDYLLKLSKYQQAGVREYWIVDPLDLTVMVYNFENQDVEKYTFKDQVKAGIYEDLFIDFSEIELY